MIMTTLEQDWLAIETRAVEDAIRNWSQGLRESFESLRLEADVVHLDVKVEEAKPDKQD
jgi:hypothetical protein